MTHPNPHTDAQEKAATLIEALPWLRRFHGRIVVVKYGGNAMVDEELRVRFAENIVFLRYAGLRPVVVHGGGPQINAQLDRLGVESTFTAGLRVTTRETLDVVRMVLTGQVNRDIVGLINAHGPLAVGMSGEDAQLLTAERKTAEVDGETVDIGHVGEVVRVDPSVLTTLLDDGRIPVVSSIARAPEGVYNVNADTAAAALAVGLGASKLIMLTDVEGLFADYPQNTDLISRLTASRLRAMLGDLSAGMVPKMEACLRAVTGGVPQAHVIDGRVPNSMLLEVFTNRGIGTMVVHDSEQPAGADTSAPTSPDQEPT
ncbi:acetylglutamate kinase [Spiractinospora alimapuensis]|uniref:acetylglutamate kinase n=1 Tax=Spiractinospora alimapuensis TaxID=2820884 RepID=UPI001EEBE9B2|nr:acetylglutamate kinase [Spiractinospora alimapuensis]QVQ52080.1 acetylglutamate kinase [Spiractinospora alimapuensis]